MISGYRVYDASAVQQVRFIRRAQQLGFTLQEIRDLLGMWNDSAESCQVVEGRASSALGRIDNKIEDLNRMRRGLAQYVAACQRRRSLDECPLLQALGGPEGLEK
ncbi:MAG: MerR family DNA-binding protein [Gemmatimonadaceae bacterium]